MVIEQDNAKRIFTFGKHKGEFIMEIIRTDPGYVEWLLLNVKQFKLNSDEKSFYDQTVKDWFDAWANVRYAFKTGPGASKEMHKTVEAYKKGELKPRSARLSADLSGIQRQFGLHINNDEYDEIDDICLGVDPMALF